MRLVVYELPREAAAFPFCVVGSGVVRSSLSFTVRLASSVDRCISQNSQSLTTAAIQTNKQPTNHKKVIFRSDSCSFDHVLRPKATTTATKQRTTPLRAASLQLHRRAIGRHYLSPLGLPSRFKEGTSHQQSSEYTTVQVPCPPTPQ